MSTTTKKDEATHEVMVSCDGAEMFRVPGGDDIESTFDAVSGAMLAATLDGMAEGSAGIPALLKALTEVYPPGPRQRHNITLTDDSNALCLTLMLGEKYHSFGISREDLLRSPLDVTREIAGLLRKQGVSPNGDGR